MYLWDFLTYDRQRKVISCQSERPRQLKYPLR